MVPVRYQGLLLWELGLKDSEEAGPQPVEEIAFRGFEKRFSFSSFCQDVPALVRDAHEDLPVVSVNTINVTY